MGPSLLQPGGDKHLLKIGSRKKAPNKAYSFYIYLYWHLHKRVIIRDTSLLLFIISFGSPLYLILGQICRNKMTTLSALGPLMWPGFSGYKYLLRPSTPHKQLDCIVHVRPYIDLFTVALPDIPNQTKISSRYHHYII